MDGETRLLGGLTVFLCPVEGAAIASEVDAVDLIGGLWGQGADWLALPVTRLGDGFLRLRTGIAGAVIQKFVTYQVRLAIVGDISAEMAESDALRDFVRESNAGDQVWFVPDLLTLETRLSA